MGLQRLVLLFIDDRSPRKKLRGDFNTALYISLCKWMIEYMGEGADLVSKRVSE